MVVKVLIIIPGQERKMSDLTEDLMGELLAETGHHDLLLFPALNRFKDVRAKSMPEIVGLASRITTLFSRLARSFGLYLSPGYIIEKNGSGFYRSAILFDPAGDLVLKQRQLFLTGREQRNGLLKGRELKVLNTRLGQIGFLVGRDCYYPEVARFLTLQGVDIVLAINQQQAMNCWQQLAGVWSQVQQNQFYALETATAGQDLIHGPCEISPYRTGILAPQGSRAEALTLNPTDYFQVLAAKVKRLAGFKLVAGRLDQERLRKIRTDYPLKDYLNPRLYEKSGLKTLLPGKRVGK